MCEHAKEMSAFDVARGLPPNWPSSAACGNITHEQHRLYTSTVSLRLGRHTLRTGMMTMVSLMNYVWGSSAPHRCRVSPPTVRA